MSSSMVSPIARRVATLWALPACLLFLYGLLVWSGINPQSADRIDWPASAGHADQLVAASGSEQIRVRNSARKGGFSADPDASDQPDQTDGAFLFPVSGFDLTLCSIALPQSAAFGSAGTPRYQLPTPREPPTV